MLTSDRWNLVQQRHDQRDDSAAQELQTSDHSRAAAF